MSGPAMFRHVAGGIYCTGGVMINGRYEGPDYLPVTESDRRWLLDVLGDEITGALRKGIKAERAHRAANDLLKASLEASQWNREYAAMIASRAVGL